MKKITTMKELLNERLSEKDIIKLVSNYDNKFSELEKDNKEKDKEIERLNNIINELEKKIISICETCYEDRETARIEKWIKELKGGINNG